VWVVMASVLCQQTVVPESTVTSGGVKAKPEIVISVSPAGQVEPAGRAEA
jgi:hypothetical protein